MLIRDIAKMVNGQIRLINVDNEKDIVLAAADSAIVNQIGYWDVKEISTSINGTITLHYEEYKD